MLKTWQKIRNKPQLFQPHKTRAKIIQLIREFFLQKQFFEVEVPLLAPSLPAESYLEIFETTLLNRLRQSKRAFLTASPEMFLKKLLVAGIGDCFTITKSFRNTEDMSNTHNPEFTILEWYEVEKDYKDLMKTTEELFVFIYYKIYSSRLSSNNKLTLNYQSQTVNLTPPWERLSMIEAFAKYAQMDLEKCLTIEPMRIAVQKKGYKFSEKNTWEELFHQIYLNEVEPNLGKNKPMIIYDFPSQMAALAKKKTADPRFAERFEVYIAGLELGDCYSELTDWKEQEERFKKETEERQRLGKIAYPYDSDFINALKAGLPKCSGLAMGVDRVVMLFADASSIQEVLFFSAKEMWES